MAAAFSWETTSSCRAEDLVIGDVDVSKFVEELVNFLWCRVDLHELAGHGRTIYAPPIVHVHV